MTRNPPKMLTERSRVTFTCPLCGNACDGYLSPLEIQYGIQCVYCVTPIVPVDLQEQP